MDLAPLFLWPSPGWRPGRVRWGGGDPTVLTADLFAALQPAFQQLLHGAGLNALYVHAQSVGRLLLEYEKLERLGTAIIHMNEYDTMSLDDTTSASLGSIYDPNSGIAYPAVIDDGKILLHSYTLGIASSVDPRITGRSEDAATLERQRVFDLYSFNRLADSLHFDYEGGAEWAAMFFYVRGASTSRPSLDFSGFDKLQLELKGDAGGEEILVNIKDSTDPDDGSQTNVPLTLTNEWQLYEIDLARFRNADLNPLHVVLAFLFFDEPKSFSLRNARYLRVYSPL